MAETLASAAPLPLTATSVPKETLYAHLRIVPEYAEPADLAFADSLPDIALSYLMEAYGFDGEYAGQHPDIAVAVLALCRDMYDNRGMTADKPSENMTVSAIMHAHDFNAI